MRILITGATGFVGKTLIPYLFSKGVNDLVLLVRNLDKAKAMFCKESVEMITTQSSDWMEQVKNANPDVTLHLAAFFTGRHDHENVNKLVEANISFTTFLMEALSNTLCQHFINIGTFSEFRYGDGEYHPNNLYSATKTAERPIIRYYQSISKWNWINVVVYSPYGRYNAYKKVIDYMIDSFSASEPVDFTMGEQILDFIHVDDMADFFYTLLQKLPELKDSYYQFHLGTGKGHSIREVASKMEEVWGKKMNANWGGRAYSEQDIMHAVAPIEQNLQLLGWKAKISINQGLEILKKDTQITPPILENVKPFYLCAA